MRCFVVLSLCLLLGVGTAVGQSDRSWTQLSLSSSNVDAYLKANSTLDGRGIVVAILDTGVDMGVAGLQKTSTGDVKVIDVQDFSGQGAVSYERAVWNDAGDKLVHYNDKGAPEFYAPPAIEHRGEGKSVWLGFLKEKAFRNSAVPDINDSGKTDDTFAVCVITDDGGTADDAVCFVDMDSDRDLAEERPLKNYKLRYDSFTFPRAKKEKQTEPLTIALNIFPKKRTVVFHYDDGGHGTHVAGIATGYRIQNQDGFNGVAPGANVISLKLGNNVLAGGATTTGSKKQAFEYAARYAREHNVTVVCNLSFGIGSIREGASDIDKFLDKLLRENPGLIVCTSAGNEGPGLSCVGTPAAAPSAITVAALLAVDTAKDVRAEDIPAPQLTQFSSRGGEIDKPDIATPGMMTSTVPKWTRRGDFWQGTSMASPYAAGLSALLANRVRAAGGVPRADWVKLALKAGASPIPGYTTLDYGAGLPDIAKAAAVLDELVKARAGSPLYAFDVSTDCPLAVDGKGGAAYWRTSHVPVDRPQVFTIKPVFVPSADATDVIEFATRLELSSDADWCSTKQTQIYFRSEQSATVEVEYDAAKSMTPGLHVATITGMIDGVPFLRLVNSVVVPHRVGAASDYKLKLENQTVTGWKVRRHFVEVPAGASAMHVTLDAVDGKESTAWMYGVFRPDGRLCGHRGPVRLDTLNDRLTSTTTVSKELSPGIWELPVTCRGADETSAYDLTIWFDGVHAEPAAVADMDSKPGDRPSGDVVLTNVFDRPVIVDMSGVLEGYRKRVTKKLTADDHTANIPLALTSKVRAVRVRVETSDKDYAKFTDCAINVYNAAGKAIAQDGLGEPVATVEAENPDPDAESVSCKLEIEPAFTHPDADVSAEFEIVIDYLYAEPIDIAVTQGDRTSVRLYPGIPTKFEYELSARPEDAPDGTSRLGVIRAIERRSKQAIAEIEICED